MVGKLVFRHALFIVVWLSVAMIACAAPQEASQPTDTAADTKPDPPAIWRMEVVARYPHDPRGFTQGLLWHDGFLYESTGRYGLSELRRVELETGRVLDRRPLDDAYFGEGLARIDDRLVQLTWKAGVARVYDRESLEPIDEWSYGGEGWGLAYDATKNRLVRSSGSARLTFHDLENFTVLDQVDVTYAGQLLGNLNELEVVDGAVWANVWQREQLVRIDPSTGAVDAVVDARGLLSREERRGTDVMNGVAYDAETDLFYITGKLWPALFAVRLHPPRSKDEPRP